MQTELSGARGQVFFVSAKNMHHCDFPTVLAEPIFWYVTCVGTGHNQMATLGNKHGCLMPIGLQYCT